MPAPVTPSQFEQLIVQPNDTLAQAILKTFVKLPVLLYKLTVWMFNSDGSLSAAFRADICSVTCPDTTTTTTTP